MQLQRRDLLARHTAPVVHPPSPPGPLRRWLVPSVLWIGLVGAAAVGGYALLVAYQPERLALEHRAPLGALQPWLPGQTLHVPEAPGLWAAQLGDTGLVLARAVPDGPAQAVSLCQQVWGGRDDPASLYPMALVAGLPGPGADKVLRHRTTRQPIVLSAALAAGLPAAWVEGRLADGTRPAELQLHVRPSANQQAGTWQVGLASPLHAGNASGNPGVSRYALGHEAWLLWSPLPAAADAADRPRALAGASPGFRWGVRIRRVAQPGCASGGLEWQLFSGTAADGGQRVSSVLLVQRAGTEALARPLRVPVSPGTHQVPELAPARLEDRALFDQALAGGLIQPLADGRLASAPADAEAEAAHRPLLKTLHRSANGQHVLSQLRLANQDRHWLALRLRPMNGAPLPVAAEPARWHLAAGGELTGWASGLPPVATRLQVTPDTGYTRWTRVLPPAGWLQPVIGAAPADSAPPPVRVALPVITGASLQSESPADAAPRQDAHAQAAVRAPAGPARLQVLVLGRVLRVEGARVLADDAACDGPGCAAPEVMRRLTLELQPQATELVLLLADQPAFNRLNPSAAEHRKVQWQGRQLAWVDDDAAQTSGSGTPVDVSVLAQDGQTLYTHGMPTPLARQLGLAPLVGLGPQHGRSLAGSLARLGAHGQAQAIATTTLEPGYQASLLAVLACQGQLGGRWLAAEQRCEQAGGELTVPAARITAAVMLDARSGAVLAAASGRAMPPELSVDELLAFDAFNPGNSPLAVPAWQHTGGSTQTPGSAFKVVDALMLEQLGQRSASLGAWLQGLPGEAMDAQARALGLPFSAASPCYPAPCRARTKQVENYRDASLLRYTEQGRFGLVQALRQSVNTWFAVLAEHTDRTLRAGHADARPLGQAALRDERPLLALSDELGLNQPLQLDGGLLPADHRWLSGDVLAASATSFDALIDEHSARQQALGLRMQTTPLHLARVAAGVATGQVPAVHVLQQLNGVSASPGAGPALSMPLARVRQGMHEVVRAGTAAGAFSLPVLQAVRTHVHGKTGTAPLATRPEGAQCPEKTAETQLPAYCLHNAWFIGYLQPGALPGETRTLAFAVQVSHTRHTGGAAAAGVVAAWLGDHWVRHEQRIRPAAVP